MDLSTGNYPFNSKFHNFFRANRDKFVLFLYGGAGSGKSVAICQDLIYRCMTERDIRILVLRKTSPSLRISTFQMLLDLLGEYGIPHRVNYTDMTIRIRSNIIWCRGLDEEHKKKSVNVNYAYLEEATEFSYSEFQQIKLRARRQNERQNQIYLSFNPVDAFHWTNTEGLQRMRPNMAAMHSTYHDNIGFLPREYVEELEALKDQDTNFYKVYTLGIFGELKDLVYTNYSIGSHPSIEWDETIYGLDFGYNNPTALCEIGIKDGEYYLRELLYCREMTNQDLVDTLPALVPEGALIYADSAEPARIQEIRRAGYVVYPADKSVKDGIDFVKRQKLHVDENSPNLIAELRGYKYRRDKDGNMLEEPVRFRDHLMDCVRYAMYTHARQQGQVVCLGGLAEAFRNW